MRAPLHPHPRRRRHPARAEGDVPRPAGALLRRDPRLDRGLIWSQAHRRRIRREYENYPIHL